MTVKLHFFAALFVTAVMIAGLDTAHGAEVPVTQPQRLSAEAQRGKAAFEQYCQQCHGDWGQGSQSGPPLIHKIYEPSHHGDAAFFFAITRGSRQHHWNFGNMPPQPQVKQDDIPAIIRFVREVQEVNGIR